MSFYGYAPSRYQTNYGAQAVQGIGNIAAATATAIPKIMQENRLNEEAKTLLQQNKVRTSALQENALKTIDQLAASQPELFRIESAESIKQKISNIDPNASSTSAVTALETILSPIKESAQQGDINKGIAKAAEPVTKDIQTQFRSTPEKSQSGIGFSQGVDAGLRYQPVSNPVSSQPATREQLVSRASEQFTASGRPVPTTDQLKQSPTYENLPSSKDLASQELLNAREQRLGSSAANESDRVKIALQNLKARNRGLGIQDQRLRLDMLKEESDQIAKAKAWAIGAGLAEYNAVKPSYNTITGLEIPKTEAEKIATENLLNAYSQAIDAMTNQGRIIQPYMNPGTPYEVNESGNMRPAPRPGVAPQPTPMQNPDPLGIF